MQALLTLGRTGTSATAEQLGIYRILLTQAGRRELQAQFDEILGAVVAEQKHRNVPILATLKAFLDHGCRAAPTARALDIHVNTLYQRIALLDRLLGPDWRQPPDHWTSTSYSESSGSKSHLAGPTLNTPQVKANCTTELAIR